MNCCDRCGQPLPTPVYEVGRLRVDIAERRITVDAQEILLTPMEFTILATLARRPGMLFTRDVLLEQLSEEATDHSLRVTVSHLRAKLRGAATISDGRRAGIYGTKSYKLISR